MPKSPSPSQNTRFEASFQQAKSQGGAVLKAWMEDHGKAVLRVIRARMRPTRLRSQYDSDDFMQRARLKLELCNLADKHFETAEEFLAYMIRVTQNDIAKAARKQGHEEPLDGLSPAHQQKITAHDPQPEDIVATEDMWRHALAQLPLQHRGVAWMLREEYKEVEIAEKLGISDRTVRRVLKKLQEILRPDAK